MNCLILIFHYTVMESIKKASMTNKTPLKDNTHTRNLTMNKNLVKLLMVEHNSLNFSYTILVLPSY